MLESELEGLFNIIKNFQKKINTDELIKTGLSFKFSKKLIDRLEKDYYEKPDKDIIKLCEMY
jgi:uncharacterized protein YeeX (DUF496 family)